MAPGIASRGPTQVDFDISKNLFENSDSENEAHAQLNGLKKDASEDEEDSNVLDGLSDDEDIIMASQIASNRKSHNVKGKSVKRGGGFQAMGLTATLLKAITRKGFTVPTPIQRKTIPLIMENSDVVGMARTGSGKTAAFVIPLIQKLRSHSVKVGARAVIFSPSRELALQTLKVVKELGKGTDLRTVLLVGGDSLDEQFACMASNPDIVVATPGRFLHLKVEMGLELSSMKFVVFDEADRLFEMGFAVQLTEIVTALPSSRQTLLFSATMPKNLVEFARAGLVEPKLVRLDAESKVSPNLQSAFFTLKSSEREGALLYLLRDVIRVPLASASEDSADGRRSRSKFNKKRKRNDDHLEAQNGPSEHSTIIFAATKHHVEYLTALLRGLGYPVSHVYGSLDQTARNSQVQDFRNGTTSVLVVTDVAARGIDIPIIANVINYDFPPQPKVFVHRVGRTARAGRQGWSYSLVRESELPYLLDLQLFLSRKLVLGRSSATPNFTEDLVLGSFIRDTLETACADTAKLLDDVPDLDNLRVVAMKGEKLYLRSRNAASTESSKRAKQIAHSKELSDPHLLFNNEIDDSSIERQKMLAVVSGFRPQETVFEIGRRGKLDEAAEIMKRRREKIVPKYQDKADDAKKSEEADETSGMQDLEDIENRQAFERDSEIEEDSEEELDVTIHPDHSNTGQLQNSWQDSENFMSYNPMGVSLAEERGYGVHSGAATRHSSNFLEAARGITMDLAKDESKSFAEPSKAGLRWDKRSKNYVKRANDEDGSKGSRMIKGESGQKLAASFKSGRFDAWRKANRLERLPRVGEEESTSTSRGPSATRHRYKHRRETAPRPADKYRDDFAERKQRVAAAQEKRIGRFAAGEGRNELRSAEDIRKQRRLKQKRREKNARPSKKNRG